MMAVLEVLLLLLKWVGILLLVLLGLVLVTLLLVLLAPIRYKGELDKKEAPEEIFRADGLISWLNPLLRVRIRYTEKKLHYTVRIFGLCLLDSNKPKKEKKQKEKKKELKKKAKKKKSDDGGLTEGQAVLEAPEPTGTEAPAMVSAENAPVQGGAEELPETENVPEDTGENEGKKKVSVFAKLKQFIDKVKRIPETVKQKVVSVVDTIKLLWYKKEKVVIFFEDELHRTAMGTAWETVIQVLRHVLPGKIKGHVEFGTGDPASTGKALGVLGVFYAWYGKGITVVPDFYEKRIVAELRFRGRIRCGTLLVKGIRLLRDKNVKRFRKNFKKLLTVLKQKAK